MLNVQRADLDAVLAVLRAQLAHYLPAEQPPTGSRSTPSSMSVLLETVIPKLKAAKARASVEIPAQPKSCSRPEQ